MYPSPERGRIFQAFHDETSGHTTFRCVPIDVLHFELVEKFTVEARRGLLIRVPLRLDQIRHSRSLRNPGRTDSERQPCSRREPAYLPR